MHGTVLPFLVQIFPDALLLLVANFNSQSISPQMPASVTSYSRDLATRLSALREVAALLVDEQRAYHREFINARRPDPKIYSIGDTVFPRRATCSSAVRGQVDKLIYPFTGPWLITAKLDGTSYEIEHVATKRKDKRHASDLSPYPSELIAFQPLDGADNPCSPRSKSLSLNIE